MTAIPGDSGVLDARAGPRPGYAGHKAAALVRLRRIEGQVRGVTRMVEQDRYCMDALTQLSAATRAMQEVAVGLLDDHIRHCLLDAASAGPARGAAKRDELIIALRRAQRI